MAIGTLFTLFVVPSIYVLMAKNRTADRSEDTPPAQAVAAPES
jgi:hypothetical protein